MNGVPYGRVLQPFHTPLQRRVAALLLEADRDVSTLAVEAKCNARSLTRRLKGLEKDGVVHYDRLGHPRPGRPAGTWRLTQAGRLSALAAQSGGAPQPHATLGSAPSSGSALEAEA